MKTCLAAFCCLFLLNCSVAHAERLEDPYVIDMPVASQSATDREAAMRSGLLVLLERLSGQQVGADPNVKSALTKAERYVQQFSYMQDKSVALNPTAAWRIRLVFSPQQVNPLLTDAGVALWPLDRPSILLLMVNEQGALLPVSVADGVDVIESLVSLGKMRGIPLLIPNPAAQDITVAANVQNLDAAALVPQMQQAKADALLIGTVRGSDTVGWSGQWVLRFKDVDQTLQQKAATLPALVDAVLRQSAAYLSGLYVSSAVVDSGPAQLRLQIEGVRTYPAYMQLRQYLEKMEAIQHIGSMQINGTTVIVDVDVKGRESFRNLMMLFKSLQWQEEIVPPQGSEPSLRPVWRYQWVQ